MAFFDFLESFLKGVIEETPGSGDTESVRKIVALLDGVSPDRARFLAAFAYLMARVAHADFDVSDKELAHIRQILEVRGTLPASQAEAVAELARRQTVHEGSTEDFLVTRSRDTIFQVISFGQPGLGMQAFGLPYGGQLTDQEIRVIVDFIESWYVSPEEEAAGPDLSLIETPSYAQHVQPILDKRCASCHSRRLKGNFSVVGYDNFMTTGDNAPVIIAGDAANSILVQMLHGVKTDAGGQMPPARALRADQIQLIERWIDQGAQNN